MKTWVYKKFIKHFLKIFHSDDIIVFKKDGTVLISGKKITDQKLESLRLEADALKHNDLLNLILKTVRTHAENQILYFGTDMEVVNNNRASIYVVGQIEKMINLFTNYDKTLKARDEFMSDTWK